MKYYANALKLSPKRLSCLFFFSFQLGSSRIHTRTYEHRDASEDLVELSDSEDDAELFVNKHFVVTSLYPIGFSLAEAVLRPSVSNVRTIKYSGVAN